MKKNLKIIYFLTIILTITSCASSTKATEVKVNKLSKIINTENTKNKLYLKANDWMINTFGNAESVIQFSDKEAGVITGKYLMGKSLIRIGNSHTFTPSYENVYSIIKIQVKNKAAKITISPKPYLNGTINISGKINKGYDREQAIKDMNFIINSFSEYIQTENDDF